MEKKWIRNSIITIGALIIISLVVNIWLSLGQSFRFVFGLVLTLLIPGFVWTWVFWKNEELDTLERVSMSLLLSIIIVPLVMFFLSEVGVSFTAMHALLVVLLTTFVGILVIILTKTIKPSRAL